MERLGGIEISNCLCLRQLQVLREAAADAQRLQEVGTSEAAQKLQQQEVAQQAQHDEAKAAASKAARNAKEDVRAARQEAHVATEKLESITAEHCATQEAFDLLQQRLEEVTAELAAASQAQEAAQLLRRQLEESEAEVAAAEGRLSTLHAQLASRTDESHTLQQQLATASTR